MAELKVSFPAPCSEAWDAMAPRGCNRHCASCDTVVHDLAKMTAAQTDRLFDSGEKVCVRAEIEASGRIKTARDERGAARPLLACAGASLSLLAAACQTTPGGRMDGGFELSGTVPWYPSIVAADITSPDGETVGLHVGRDRRFDVHDLRPGAYRLTFTDFCREVHEFADVIITDSDVDLGTLKFDATCIIVGQMKRAVDEAAG
jgi:hypothetical protein